MNSSFKKVTIFLLAATTAVSCIPARKYEEMQTREQKCNDENKTLRVENQDLNTKLTEQASQLTDIKKRMSALESDTTVIGKSLRTMTRNYDKLNDTYELLLQKNRELLAGNAQETKKLSGELSTTLDELQRKQDAIKEMERDLDAKKKSLEELNKELMRREIRVNELEEILRQKDQAVDELKKKVQAALVGFENNGLTIQQKNGKVYVSLDEKLLFASGSTTVDPKGVEALKKLAKVLEQNADINVMIEGHTDNVPYNSAGGSIKDNWDLSVLRATNILKVIVNNSKVSPSRLTAAGRGEYMPVDPANTAEARKKNRRTEIILTPKLDELFKVLESN